MRHLNSQSIITKAHLGTEAGLPLSIWDLKYEFTSGILTGHLSTPGKANLHTGTPGLHRLSLRAFWTGLRPPPSVSPTHPSHSSPVVAAPVTGTIPGRVISLYVSFH